MDRWTGAHCKQQDTRTGILESRKSTYSDRRIGYPGTVLPHTGGSHNSNFGPSTKTSSQVLWVVVSEHGNGHESISFRSCMDASMSSDWLLVIGGFALLLGGGEVVVQGAVTIAKKMKVPPLLIGFTIVAIGTSLPELAVSLEAVAGGQPDIAVGGVLGSNVANVMLVLGTASILGAASDPGEGVRRDALAMILATLILLALVIFGEITWFFGIMMLALLAGYYSYSYLNSKEDSERKLEESWVPDNIVIAMVVTIIGGALIWKGAEFLVDGATGIASGLGISEAVIGLSVVALGTSLPELAVTLVAGLRGQGGVAVGNILGSNMMNILGILGATAALGGGIMISSNFADRDIWVVLVTSGLVAAMLLDDREIGKITGVSMVVGYLVYMSIIL